VVFLISRRKQLVDDDEGDGCSKSTRTEVNIAAVADLVKNDCRIASRMIAEYEHLQDCSSSDMKEDLGNRKLCACFVPHSLTPEQREDRVTSGQDIIAMANADKI